VCTGPCKLADVATDYSMGDYRVVAQRLQPAAQELVAAAAPAAGNLVVDVAAGTGNVARLCTERGATVVAVDRSREQLLLGREDPDPDIAWVVGDAVALPVGSQLADAALSTFGLIYVEEPAVAVAEMARVCRPGGVIGLTAWQADGYQKAFATLLRQTLDLQVTHDFLVAWGTPAAIEQQLSLVAGDVQVHTADLVDRFPTVDDWWRARGSSPPMANARSLLDDAGYAELGRRMRALATEFGESDDGLVLRDRYLVATARFR
jgi:ubiquinone/menaquinone biosynthesis C-methylase UbiE